MAKYLSAAEAAEILEVSADSVRRWAAEGKIPHWVTPGGQVRFTRATIDALVMPAGPEAEPEVVADVS